MSSSKIHIETPLLLNTNLTKLIGHDVYLKLDNNQPSGSFKLRGIGYNCQKEVERGCQRFISASGGNAGVAVATAGKALNIPVTVYIPKTSPKLVIETIKNLDQEVIVHGQNFNDASDKAVEEGKKPGNSYIHPFVHPETWEGHSSLIDEIKEQLQGQRPGCLLVSVGGGGLLLGLLRGLEKRDWTQVPVFCFETVGADCFNKSLKAGHVVELPQITSIAHTLGAKSVPPALMNEIKKFPNLTSHVVTDAQAVESCIKFADDQRILVEPSCGAALAGIYCGIVKEYMTQTPLQGPIVVIVCGGSGINLSLLANYAKKFNIPFPPNASL